MRRRRKRLRQKQCTGNRDLGNASRGRKFPRALPTVAPLAVRTVGWLALLVAAKLLDSLVLDPGVVWFQGALLQPAAGRIIAWSGLFMV